MQGSVKRWKTPDPPYRTAILIAGVLQAVLIGFGAITFDFGVILRSACLALVPFWGMVLWILSRRLGTPTKPVILLIKYGFVPIFLLVYAVLNFT